MNTQIEYGNVDFDNHCQWSPFYLEITKRIGERIWYLRKDMMKMYTFRTKNTGRTKNNNKKTAFQKLQLS